MLGFDIPNKKSEVGQGNDVIGILDCTVGLDILIRGLLARLVWYVACLKDVRVAYVAFLSYSRSFCEPFARYVRLVLW